MPPKPTEDEGDETPEFTTPPLAHVPHQGVADVWARKRRIAQSKKDALRMWGPIMDSFRAYGERLTYIHVIEDLSR